ncbi:SusC/RagA family TonB-linked outer membrane protein [Sinomicrobium weinanense]|uniref:SusC/RagA family TonB-linked outer membrane protein n=1 Tax=Sinomicrobium weinanense TaxID=2842200 RepID=A0A926JRH8_9FLAO|nr:SusC/RagA family TonB-linked outer membrane protein [Sinomicrobium weinanense]MBC9796157.1 SusC/RagA family TonB-linked outer membrane protein [Sinomicrobium weinanense]MBU3121908.1 SusC/RagA family TonB-linked outer membrane protein [Sinomicrobium weinanense]
MKQMLLLLLFGAGIVAYGQEKTVSGRVVSEDDGTAIMGVNVLVKGTTRGTITGEEGEYTMAGVGPEDILVFRYLGYEPLEIRVGGRSTVNVSLSPSTQALDEVVVTALGISREKKSLGYATQEVGGENFTMTNEQNVVGSLAGRVAGVQVTGASGASMGGTQKIKIRGVNSLGGEDEPLIVVDGTPISNANFSNSAAADYGNLSQDINPADIESVNVLKGPAASALYGIRGQYGVIMITTKKGKKGQKDVRVELNSSFAIEKTGNFMPLQNIYGGGSNQAWKTLPNGQKYVDMNVDESWGPKMDGTPVRQVFSFYPQDEEYGQLTPFVPHPDNIKDFYETGFNFNNSVTITGGNENTTYRLSFNDTRIEGVEPNTYLKRNNLGLSASLDITDKLKVSTNINYARNDGRRPRQGSEFGTGYFVQWFQRNVDMKRMKDYRYDDGTFLHWNLRQPDAGTGEITDFDPLYWDNPYFDAYENTNNDRRDRFFGDVKLSYKVLPELEISGAIRSDMFTQNIETRTAFGGNNLPAYTIGKYQNTEMNYELIAQYNNRWDDFSLNGTLGGNVYYRRYSYLYQQTVGGLSAPGYYNIEASVDRPVNESYLLRKQIRSMFGMVSLGYKDTYYIEASIRNDNSSALPKDNNSYWYPSVSGSFVFGELLDWQPLSFGKLRLSYAKAGSDLNPYQIGKVFDVGTVYGEANTLNVPNELNNPNIKPSFAHSYEAGLDLRFFNNRLGLDFTYYQQKNKDQIIKLDISGASGYTSTVINAGLIENKGFEVALNARPVQTENFTWETNFNINRNRSEVVELAPGIDVYNYGSTTYSGVTSYLNSYEGKPYGSLVGQAYQRDPDTGKVLLGEDNMPLYTDATHDFGTVLPDFTGGFQNNFRIGRFSIAAMIDFQGGGQFFSRSKMLAAKTGQDPVTAAMNDRGNNVRDPVEDGGGVKVTGISAQTGEEVSTYVDAKSYYRNTLGTRVYEEWLYDASYIKLREVRLGYSFSDKLLEKLPFKSVNISLIARNPAMIWQEAPKGLDPSEISAGSEAVSWYESGQLISVRSYGINLNVTF